ncbi:hypothetical protein [Deinococcus multiflagellatus]|uniref:Uncharacterized protein n=1 Tax=Deinococcus multiflagellatus TaxID=1656887 RepID=A0ABW1ZU94_9DEIO|nr:hypothetical protein [Deinococcus multiflagellatus]MBZ9714514.1 hypothetical protein [Deinococcus multiflagellatus]
MGEQLPIELRTVLKALSDRYELFEFTFIESISSPAHIQDQMKSMINDSDGVIMIFHKLDAKAARASREAADRKGGVVPGKGIVKEGVEFELQYAIETQRPIFLLTEQKFLDHAPSKAYLHNVWGRAHLSSRVFSTTKECADAIEQSLFAYIVNATKEKLRYDGQSKLSSSGSTEPTES